MTAHIQQHVIPRQRRGFTFSHHISSTGTWQVRPLRPAPHWINLPRFSSQQGSVTQSTITVAFSIVALLVIAGFGFIYLQQVLGTASQGSDVQALESQLVELREQQRQLELEGAQLRSIQAVEQRVERLNLVATDRVAYLVPVPDRVAAAY